MLLKEEEFLEGSSRLEDLPIRVVTGEVEVEDAKQLCENINRALDELVRAELLPNHAYSIRKPDERF